INTFSSTKEIKSILRIIIILATLLSLLGLFQYFTNTTPFPFCSRGRAYSIFITPNTFAAYLNLILPLLFIFFFISEKKKFLLTIILVNWLAFLATQSRSGYISLFLSLLIILPFLIRKRKDLPGFSFRFFILFFALLISTIFFFLQSSIFMRKDSVPIAIERSKAIVSPFEASSAQARLKFYKSAIKVIKKYPFSGTGFYTFHLIYPSVKDPSFRGTTHFYVHNDYLQIFSELGIFGLISFLSIIFLYLYFSFSLLKKLPNYHPLPSREGKTEEGAFILILGTLGGSLSFLIHSFFEFNFYIMALAMILFFYFALSFIVAKQVGVLKSRGRRGNSYTIKIKPSLKRPLYCLGLFSFLVVAFFVLCPLLSEIYTNRGNAFFRKGEYKKAEKLLRRALFFCPLVSNYHTNLANTYNILGKRERAEAEYKKGVNLSPYRVRNCADFGQFYLESPFEEEREKSIFYLKRATFLDPNCEFYNLRLGIAYKKLKKPKKAIEQFLKYQRFHPEDLRVKVSLAECYLSSGNKKKTLFYLQEVLSRNPKNRVATSLLERIRD
ncbi:MAG: O-antigen ligase family protein, partial [Candidatus Omnitrophica bacterium]|nr:O-antigen ligase family protein [Candidatus Omnitrophota bacterium]